MCELLLDCLAEGAAYEKPYRSRGVLGVWYRLYGTLREDCFGAARA